MKCLLPSKGHVGIRNKPACKATLQRLQLMARDERSTLLLISRVASCIADSAVASSHSTGPLMYTVPGLHSIYMPQLVHDIPECCVVASGMPPALRGLCFISTNYYIETCCNSWGGGVYSSHGCSQLAISRLAVTGLSTMKTFA